MSEITLILDSWNDRWWNWFITTTNEKWNCFCREEGRKTKQRRNGELRCFVSAIETDFRRHIDSTSISIRLHFRLLLLMLPFPFLIWIGSYFVKKFDASRSTRDMTKPLWSMAHGRVGKVSWFSKCQQPYYHTVHTLLRRRPFEFP